MSGGSFDYLCFRIDDYPLEWTTLETLKGMAEWLLENEQHGAAKELEELHSFLTGILSQINSRLTPSLLEMIKGAEWWCSNDISRTDFEAVWQKHSGLTPVGVDAALPPSSEGQE